MSRKYDIFGEPIEMTDDEILIELEDEASRNEDAYVFSLNCD
jgi:hypothetical protein